MNVSDLKLISHLGQTLWLDTHQCTSITGETVSAVSFLDSHPERAVEKAAQALLDRANKKGMYARAANGLNSRFPEERFVLLALHTGRWSYERIARVVGETPEMVQQLAWNSRVYLALSKYPVAPKIEGADCPEYNAQRPWTQKIADEQISGQERLFLTTHLTRCAQCRQALVRTKDVYYQVQNVIDGLEKQYTSPGLTGQLHTILERGKRARYSSVPRIGESIERFLERTEVRIFLIVWLVGMIWLLKR